MSKGNPANHRLLSEWLDENEIEYEKLSVEHYRILGPISIVDVWPSRMTVHVVQTESVDPNRYFRLSYRFNPEEMADVLQDKYPLNRR